MTIEIKRSTEEEVDKYPLKIMGHELIDIRYVIDLTLQRSQNT